MVLQLRDAGLGGGGAGLGVGGVLLGVARGGGALLGGGEARLGGRGALLGRSELLGVGGPRAGGALYCSLRGLGALLGVARGGGALLGVGEARLGSRGALLGGSELLGVGGALLGGALLGGRRGQGALLGGGRARGGFVGIGGGSGLDPLLCGCDARFGVGGALLGGGRGPQVPLQLRDAGLRIGGAHLHGRRGFVAGFGARCGRFRACFGGFGARFGGDGASLGGFEMLGRGGFGASFGGDGASFCGDGASLDGCELLGRGGFGGFGARFGGHGASLGGCELRGGLGLGLDAGPAVAGKPGLLALQPGQSAQRLVELALQRARAPDREVRGFGLLVQRFELELGGDTAGRGALELADPILGVARRRVRGFARLLGAAQGGLELDDPRAALRGQLAGPGRGIVGAPGQLVELGLGLRGRGELLVQRALHRRELGAAALDGLGEVLRERRRVGLGRGRARLDLAGRVRGLRGAAHRLGEVARGAARPGIGFGRAAQRLGDILGDDLGHRVGGRGALLGVVGALLGVVGALLGRAQRLAGCGAALAPLRPELGRGELVLGPLGARRDLGDAVGQLEHPRVDAGRRGRRFAAPAAQLRQLAPQPGDHEIGRRELLGDRDAGRGLGDHLGIARPGQLDPRGLDLARGGPAVGDQLVARRLRLAQGLGVGLLGDRAALLGKVERRLHPVLVDLGGLGAVARRPLGPVDRRARQLVDPVARRGQLVLQRRERVLEDQGAGGVLAVEAGRGVRPARRQRGLQLLVHLADPAGERIALVLDGDPRLALEVEPRRQRAVEADRRRQRAGHGQQPDHQAAHQDDLTGRHRGPRHLVRPDEDAVGAAEIFDPQRALVDVEPGVHPRDPRVGAADRALGGAPHRDRIEA